MKTTFITTVLNEQGTIQALLDSLKEQTKPPDEIIIVDAGSTDQTIKMIKSHFLNTNLIIKKSFNRSQARNLAVQKAAHKFIAVSDAGCILDQDWLKRLTTPFKNPQVEAVAGFYQPESKTIFQKSAAPFVAVMPDQFDPQTYLPSSRSIAFTKKAFQKAGQYPEKLDYCEDLIFALNLKQKTNLVIQPSAIVYWQQAQNLAQFFRQIKNYAAGDVQAQYWPHLQKIISTYLRYLVLAGLPPLLLLYLLWPIFKHIGHVRHPFGLIYLPALQITKDLGIILGSLYGLLKRHT